MKHTRGECQALRILRAIIEGSAEEFPQAWNAGAELLRSLRLPANTGQVGHPLRMCNVDQLRLVAALDAEGKLTQEQIAARVGLTRAAVCYHLRPSAAMLRAIVDKGAAA
jgi:hypothetical protein